MKFIFLTYDRNLACADFVIRQYQRLWPSNPFVFRVPYNSEIPEDLFDGLKDRIEFIHAPSNIRSTIDFLTRDLPEDEWVYWNLDDKFPTKIDVSGLERLIQKSKNLTEKQVKALQFTRNRAGEFKNDVVPYQYVDLDGLKCLRKHTYRSFFQPHIIRTGHLRKIMVNNGIDGDLKEDNKDLGIMPRVDAMLGRYLPPDISIYCTKESFMCFGETLTDGKLTLNAKGGFEELGLALPENIPVLHQGWWTNEKWQLVRLTESNGQRYYSRLRHFSDPIEKFLVIARKLKPFIPMYKSKGSSFK